MAGSIIEDGLGNPTPAVPDELINELPMRIVNWEGNSYEDIGGCEHDHPNLCRDGHWYKVTTFHYKSELDSLRDYLHKDDEGDVIKEYFSVETVTYYSTTPDGKYWCRIEGHQIDCRIKATIPIGNSGETRTITAVGEAAAGKRFYNKETGEEYTQYQTTREAVVDIIKQESYLEAEQTIKRKVYDLGYVETITEDDPFDPTADDVPATDPSSQYPHFQNLDESANSGLHSDLMEAEPDTWLEGLYETQHYTDPDTGEVDSSRSIKKYGWFNPRTSEWIIDEADLPDGINKIYDSDRHRAPNPEEKPTGYGILYDEKDLPEYNEFLASKGEPPYSPSATSGYTYDAVGGVHGCMDPLASNYNPSAVVADTSCEYANIDPTTTSITGSASNNLFEAFPEVVELGEADFDPNDSAAGTASFSVLTGPKWVEEFDLEDYTRVAGTEYATCREMESAGALYIGDIKVAIPPTSIHFSSQNQSLDMPSMRTKGDPSILTNNTINRASLTLYFNGEKAINQQLRPLVAMFGSVPFTTVQNTTIFDAWIAKQELAAVFGDQEDTSERESYRCEPIPAYLESINFTTIPGFPNTIQANISIVMNNSVPYGVSPLFWKFTKDAYQEAVDNAVRYATNSTLVDLPAIKTVSQGGDDILAVEDDEGNPIPNPDMREVEKEFTYMMGGSGQYYTITKGDEIADKELVTPYPTCSWAYQKLYKNCLAEYPEAYKYSETIDPLADWPIYKAEDNEFLCMGYNSAKTLSNIKSNFTVRLNELQQTYHNMNKLYLNVTSGLGPFQPDEFFTEFKGFGLGKWLSNMLSYMSSYQLVTTAQSNIAKMLNTIGNNLNQTVLTGTPILDKDGNPIQVAPISAIEVIDKNGLIENPIEKWFEQFESSYYDMKNGGTCKDSLGNAINNLTTSEACLEDSGSNSWEAAYFNQDQWDIQLQKVAELAVKAFIDEYQNRMRDTDPGSVTNFDHVNIRIGWDHSTLSSESLETMAEFGELPSENGRDPVIDIPGVIQSISYSFANNVIPQFMAGGRGAPTYQHMGVPNADASIVLRVRDERILKVFADMRVSMKEIGTQALQNNFLIADLVPGSIGGKLGGAVSGHLLNSIGFREYTVKNINSRNIEGFPGWWEIVIDVTSNDQRIRKLEKLRLAERHLETDYDALMEIIFPTWKVNDPKKIDFLAERISAAEQFIKEQDHEGKELIRKIYEDNPGNSDWELLMKHHADAAAHHRNKTAQQKYEDIFESHKDDFIMEEGMYPVIWWDGQSQYPGGFRIGFTGMAMGYTAQFFDIGLSEHEKVDRNIKVASNLTFLIQPVLDDVNNIINNFIRFISANPDVTDMGYASDVAGVTSVFKTYLNNVFMTISSIADSSPEKFLKLGDIFPHFTAGETWSEESEGGVIIQAQVNRQLERSAFIDLLRNSAFRKFLTEYQDELNIPQFDPQTKKGFNLEEFFDNFYMQFNRSISPNYPDLRLPDIILKDTGLRIMSPGFPYVDRDMDVDVVEMEKIIQSSKLAIVSQLAALLGNVKAEDMGTPGTKDPDKIRSKVAKAFSEIKSNLKNNDNQAIPFPEFMLNDKGEVDVNEAFKVFDDAKALVDTESVVTNGPSDSLFSRKGPWNIGVSKDRIIKIMCSVTITDYVYAILAVAHMFRDSSELDSDNLDEVITSVVAAFNEIGRSYLDSDERAKLKENGESKYGEWGDKQVTKLLAQQLQTGNLEGLNVKDEERFLRMSQLLYEKREAVIRMCSVASTGDWGLFLAHFGLGDVHSSMKSLDLLTKMKQYLANKRKATMDRAFPAFKIFFIEEDNYVWHAFDDFYTYDAASEITVVESKHAASKTAVFKLSNVTSRLTGKPSFNNSNIREGSSPMFGDNFRVKVGTQVMIYMGYGPDFRHLRMKFKGAITEMNVGPVLELTAQSWGAGLLNNVGTRGPIEYGSMSGATTMGAVVLDILAQTPGLSHLGRWEIRQSTLNDPSKVSESTLKRSYWARAIKGMFGGTINDLMPQGNNITDVVGGFFNTSNDQVLPTTGDKLLEGYYRSNNMLVKSFGNSLYDNILMNSTSPKGYGFFNFWSRVADYTGFNWYVSDQNCWDALHEVALFVGDYIITTLPFNEGSDMLSWQPRETLYFGPRSGVYKAAYNTTAGSGLNTKRVIKDLMTKASKRYGELTSDPEGQLGSSYSDTGTLIEAADIHSNIEMVQIGMRILYKLFTDFYKSKGNEMRPMDFEQMLHRNKMHNMAELFHGLWRWPDLYGDSSGFKHKWESHTFSDSVEAFTLGHMAFAQYIVGDYNGFNDEGYTIDQTVKNENLDQKPAAYLIEHDTNILQFLVEMYRMDPDLYKEFEPIMVWSEEKGFESTGHEAAREYYKKTAMKVLKHPTWIKFAESCLAGTKWVDASGKATIVEQEFFDGEYTITTSALGKPDSEDYRERLFDHGTKRRPNGATWMLELAYEHHEEFYWIFRYLTRLHLALKEDVEKLMKNFLNDKPPYRRDENGNFYRNPDGIFVDLELALKEQLDIDDVFNYKPVIQFHSANSWEDITLNNIVASADSMYNHAEVLFSNEPGPENNINKAVYKTDAMLSYDQDLDFLRTYSVFMKNMDPNWFLESDQADAYHTAGQMDPGVQRQLMLTPNKIAQQVLMNVMRPMYQGTLHMLGNSHIRPWDIVQVHDDENDMYGMVEVEQVVTTISAVEGFTTTIVPNLLVYDKNLARSFDETALGIITGIRNMSLVGSFLWTAVTASTGFFILNKIGGKLGPLITRGTTSMITSSRVKALQAENKAFQKIVTQLAGKTGPEDVARYNAAQKSLKANKSTIKQLKKVAGDPKAMRKIITNVGKSGKMFLALGRLTNVAGWVWLAYDLTTFGWDWYASYHKQKIHTASLLAGENQLTWLPLEYKGEEYVAGLEGIVGTLRSANTMLYGELQMEEPGNRFIYMIDNMAYKKNSGLIEKR